MTEITVRASTEYAVKIGEHLLQDLGTDVAAVISGRSAVIVSDEHIWPIYGAQALSSLANAGFHVTSYIIAPGEASKTGDNYLKLLNFLAERQITRTDCLVALGGGVVGDLTGFTAATYLRGIPYIQVPTTLLAMVDSSVGGKTAIDLPAGKNLAGAFYPPSLVLCDIDTLKTLPQAVFTDGCAEVIKYGILFDEALFAHLELRGNLFERQQVIARCVELKAQTVASDEFDTGSRRLLNLGHTIGHSIEKASGYTVCHGAAVSTGISIMARAATSAGTCSEETRDRILTLLKVFSLPISTDLDVKTLLQHMLTDKKRNGDRITLVVPATIGCCNLHETSISVLEKFVKEGM